MHDYQPNLNSIKMNILLEYGLDIKEQLLYCKEFKYGKHLTF